jgi:NAD(P)-dependent dehydrogenase (short-subunit alcohol dehydrogenase family)
MTGALQDQTVLVVGRGGGLAQAITLAARDAGAQVVAAGRHQASLDAAYASEPGTSTETVDLTDEVSIAALGKRLGTPADIAQAVLFAMTNTFLTGQTLHIDGGEPLT